MRPCLFCERETERPKYCSVKCIKRAWYLRKNPVSYFGDDKRFWGTETGIGLRWELFVAKLLNAKHLLFNKGPDLDWDGKSVDVKVSNLYFRKNKRGKPVSSKQSGYWVFNRNKSKKIDLFFCVALKDGKPYKMLLMPDANFPKIGLVIGWKSSYDRFLFKV